MITKSLLKSAGAVLAGYVVIVILTIVMVTGVGAIWPESLDPANMASVLFNVVYGVLFAAFGGYVTARIAPNLPMRHSLILGALMAGFALLTFVGTLGTTPPAGQSPQPAWYYPVLAAISIPSVLAGAWFFTRKLAPSRAMRTA